MDHNQASQQHLSKGAHLLACVRIGTGIVSFALCIPFYSKHRKMKGFDTAVANQNQARV